MTGAVVLASRSIFVQINPDPESEWMKGNVALTFVLLGAGLLLGYLSRPRLWKKLATTLLATVALLVSVTTLVEYLTGMSFGIDAWFALRLPATEAIPNPTRMTATTALALTAYGVAILLLARGKKGAMLAHALTFGGLFLSLLALVGNLFDAQIFIPGFTLTQVHTPTILGLAALGVGLLCARPKKGAMAAILSDSPGGLIARRLIGPAIILPLVFGWIVFRGLGLKFYDAGFGVALIILSSMVVICVLTARSVVELNRLETERKKLAEARLHSDVREVGAQAASRLKSEFVANVSHELRTPMNGVLGMTSLLLDSDLNDEQREHVETIRQSGDALLMLVNEILDFSKIEAGKIVIEQKPFALANCIDEVINLLAVNARRHGNNLISFIEPHVPASFVGDSSRVRQVLLNLIGNAIKFTENGEVTVQVGAGRVEGDLYRVDFTVNDSGMGISPEALPLLFHPFQQADASATRKHGGTGLGLTISKRLVELMGGEITVSSILGTGSTFRFTLSLPTCTYEGALPEDRLPPANRFLLVGGKGRYSVMLKSQIEAWGGKVKTVQDPMEVLGLKETTFNAVLMDRNVDTISLAAQMQFDPDWNKVPRVLFDFGELLPDDRAELFAKRLTKPVKRSHFSAVLMELAGAQASAPRISGPLGLPPLATELPLRILMAEDNLINQKVGLALLSRLGYRADVVANGLEALDSVVRQTYDLVLLDIQMPEMDGLEAVQAIRKKLGERSPVLVALTANAFQGAKEEYLAQGFDDYLSKPILPPALRQLIQRVAKQVQPRQTQAIGNRTGTVKLKLR